jgi:2,4-dienoyl-CoA reductase (NADPH2)
VVGGGPAGLEAARILALRGHAVTLFERDEEPGGQMKLGRHVPGREEFAGHLPWLSSAVARAGVTLKLGEEATADDVLAGQPDIVIVATGSRLGLPAIPGILDSPVVDAYEILLRPRAGIGRALVIGGDIRGVAIARLLADRGIEVLLVEPSRELVTDIGMRSRRFQIGALAEHSKVTIHLGTTIEALGERSAVLWNDRERWQEAIDLVVPTRVLLPVTQVADELCERQPSLEIHVIGDCAQPRTALEAIHDAAALAHRL